MNVKKLKKGFTLIELLAVIAMIGVLSTVVFTSYSKYIKKSKISAAETELIQMVNEIENLFLVNSSQDIASDAVITPATITSYDQLATVGALETYNHLSETDLPEDTIFTFTNNIFHYKSHGVNVYYDVVNRKFVDQ